MDILEHALAQRIGGADGEIVEALCDEVVRLRAALSGLLDRNITYSGSDVILPFASHGIAIRQVADARELMTHKRPALAMAFATTLDNWMETASQEARNAAFYRELLDQCAQVLGPEAYTADDGSVQQDPVRLKIPELVQKLVHGACGD